MNTLDPRPVRQLTSREAVNILGGFVGAYGAVYPEDLRAALDLLAELLKDGRPIDPSQWQHLGDRSTTIIVGLAGLCSAIEAASGPETMRTAVLWWYRHVDQVLSAGGPLAAATEALANQEKPS